MAVWQPAAPLWQPASLCQARRCHRAEGAVQSSSQGAAFAARVSSRALPGGGVSRPPQQGELGKRIEFGASAVVSARRPRRIRPGGLPGAKADTGREGIALAAKLKALCRQQRWVEALACLREAGVFSSAPPAILGLGSGGAAALRLWRGASAVAVTTAVSACGRARRWDLALSLVREMQQSSLQLDVFVFGAATSSCERGQQWQRALRLLMRDLRRAGLVASEICCNALLSACGKGLQWRLTLSLLEDRSCEGPLGLVSVSAAIDACEKGQEWPRALALLWQLPMVRLAPDLIACNSAVSACASRGEAGEAQKLLRHMLLSGPAPDVVTWNSAISACSRADCWQQAFQLLGEMRLRRLTPGVVARNAALQGLGAATWPWALQLLRVRGSSGRQAAEEADDHVTFGTAIGALARGQEAAKALSLLAEMDAAGLEMSAVLYTAAFSALTGASSETLWERGTALLVEASSRAVELDAVLHGAACHVFGAGGRRWEQALALLADAAERDRRTLSVPFLNAAISACEKGSEWRSAVLLLAAASRWKLRPDVTSHNAAISACEKGRQWAR
ncbi:unnamed protein product, partial [Polarella glacialis]